MSRRGEIGKIITLGTRYYVNGDLYDPYAVSNVTIQTERTGGTVLATLTPTHISTGLYEIQWTIPANTPLGTLYDSWTHQATSDMAQHTRVYSFTVSAYSDASVKPSIHGPLFVGHQEVSFFNSITKELIQKIVAQRVIYYSVSDQHTKSHQLYDEAVSKIVFPPVEINALVMYNAPTQNVTKFSVDTSYSLEIYFHSHELVERNIVPREGDFIKWENITYEVEQLTSPQIIFGQIQNKVMIKATCRVARKSQFEVLDTFKSY